MSEPRILRIYLHEGLRKRAISGDHNFIGKVENVAKNAGFRVEFRKNTGEERLKSATRRGYSLFLMDDPWHDRALTFRRVYQYPFWAIESSSKRWEWRVAQAIFPSGDVPRKEANDFYHFWQKRLFKDAVTATEQGGFVYVPLQGKLLDRRSFQYCSPIDMLKHVMTQDSDRRVVATLHPNEEYDDKELAALNKLSKEHSRLTVKAGDMQTLLQRCDYVVSQNSAAAFSGYFFGKPSVLFGRVDFHHIAANVHALGVGSAFEKVQSLTPDYAGYLHWFWQSMSINAGRPEAENKIKQAMIRAGWPM
ncbi:MAG: hypothetical protein JKY94_12210 [Rhodobacteraceae bacterium]|nr:hypothetical protein [Paracoccaceae bacterium]